MPPNKGRTAFPTSGTPMGELERQLKSFQLDSIRGHWSRAFRGPKDVQDVGRLAYNMFLADNGIFSLRVPYMRDVESELLQMCVSLFNPEDKTCGNFTSGGSESIYSALHAARSWAIVHHPRANEPEIIAPYSAHPTFSKGCHYLGLKLIRTPLDVNYRADVTAMANAITKNTIGLIGSAPCWPYGLYDPIEGIAALANDHGLWMHTDACVGGYIAPFVEKLGVKLPIWDFRSPGVMSISADLHKFGYCPKSASTILWRSSDLQEFHYVHPSDWPGGEYSTTGFLGSRSGGPIFSAWAIFKYLGESGFLKLAHQVLENKELLSRGIDMIDGLKVWKNDLFPLAFESNKVDLQIIVGEMSSKGWILLGCKEPQLINLPVDPAASGKVIDTFLAELRMVTEAAIAGKANQTGSLVY